MILKYVHNIYTIIIVTNGFHYYYLLFIVAGRNKNMTTVFDIYTLLRTDALFIIRYSNAKEE